MSNPPPRGVYPPIRHGDVTDYACRHCGRTDTPCDDHQLRWRVRITSPATTSTKASA